MDLIKQGQKLGNEGKADEAKALFARALQIDPDSYQAQLYMGVALDLDAEYDDARKHLAKAIELAPDQQAVQPLRVMAVSYAFQCNTDKAAEYERRAFDLQYNWKKYADAAATADELARIYLECGDYDNAFQWYQTGHLTALKNPDIKPAEKDLWEFRWEAALARIAARKGQGEQARQHLAAAKAILDKNANPDQVPFYPYLAGYVALYGGDYKTAIADLEGANQKDVFVLSLLAQAFEKSGDKARALEYYKKILAVNAHNPVTAFARPLAKKKLAELGS
jgi:tetratricopeptide (TPR) repeat protein